MNDSRPGEAGKNGTGETLEAGGKATLTVQLVRSVAGTRESHRATVRGLGLRKTGSTATLEDTPSVRGMIDKVFYLVRVI